MNHGNWKHWMLPQGGNADNVPVISALPVHLARPRAAWLGYKHFSLVVGFDEASRKCCEPKKGAFGVHTTLGIGWVLGVGSTFRGLSSTQQENGCRSYNLRTNLSQQMFHLAHFVFTCA